MNYDMSYKILKYAPSKYNKNTFNNSNNKFKKFKYALITSSNDANDTK